MRKIQIKIGAGNNLIIPANEDVLLTDENDKSLILVKYINNKTLINRLLFKLNEKSVQKKFINEQRTGGLKTNSFLFGFVPRNQTKRNYCRHASGNVEQELMTLLMSARQKLETLYIQHFPEIYSNHLSESKKILPDWKFNESCFSSGIINKNNQLKVHKDSGNITGCLSNMLVIKQNSQGGGLVLPDYNTTIELDTGAVVIFDGQSIAHGVTDIINHTSKSMRYSIVFYTLQQLWNCLPINEEISFYNQKREEIQNRKIQIVNLPDEIKKQYIRSSQQKRKELLKKYYE